MTERVRRSARGLRLVIAPVAAVMLWGGGTPANALVVSEVADTFGSFHGDGCDSRDTVAVRLPNGAGRITAVTPTAGRRFRDFETDAIVARLASIERVRLGQRKAVRFHAVGSDDPCTQPERYAEVGWETTEQEFVVRFRRRVSPVYCAVATHCRRRPSTVYFGASGYFAKLRWSSWGGRVARGRGRLPYNDCIPSCAAGDTAFYPASARFLKPRLCNGRWVYRLFRWRVTGPSPPSGQRTGRVSYDWLCS